MPATKKDVEATITKDREDGAITVTAVEVEPDYVGPYVDIFLPALEGGGNNGMKVDQYEHVTIANERKETCYKVLRGEHVSVPVPVFIALKERYPKL